MLKWKKRWIKRLLSYLNQINPKYVYTMLFTKPSKLKSNFNINYYIHLLTFYWFHLIGLTSAPATMSFWTSGCGFKSPYMLGHLSSFATLSNWAWSLCSLIIWDCLLARSISLFRKCWVLAKFWTAQLWSSVFSFLLIYLLSLTCWVRVALIWSMESGFKPLKW